MSLDAYTMVLLARVIEVCEARYVPYSDLMIVRENEGWEIGNPFFEATGSTLADAAANALQLLGEEVPERPSAERVQAARLRGAKPREQVSWNYFRDLYARDPLTVLALLEGPDA